MRISAGGSREAGNRRRTVLGKPGALITRATVCQGPMMLLTTGETVLEWRWGLFFVSIHSGKPKETLDVLHYMRFCEQVSCQTVHGQPQDWKGCASRFVPEEWG